MKVTNNTKLKPGFTLIEMLVVVSIIGILAGIALMGINRARARARDNRRIADLKTIQIALELYFQSQGDDGTYPYPADIYLNAPASFRQFLATTPSDPRGANYTYMAPACLLSDTAAGKTEISAVTPSYSAQLIGDAATAGQACPTLRTEPAESGWLPYVIGAKLEQTAVDSNSAGRFTSLVSGDKSLVLYSIKSPLHP